MKKPSAAMRAYLASIGRKGGQSRVRKQTPAQRSASARTAARARWAKRRKEVERYIRRLRRLERLAESFTGVAKAFQQFVAKKVPRAVVGTPWRRGSGEWYLSTPQWEFVASPMNLDTGSD